MLTNADKHNHNSQNLQSQNTQMYTTFSHPLSSSPLTMLVSGNDVSLVILVSASFSVGSSSIVSPTSIMPTTGRVNAVDFIRRGRSLHKCCNLGPELCRTGRPVTGAAAAAAAGRLMLVGF